MSEVTLVTPFPSADLPAVFRWTEPFRHQTSHCDETIEQFVRGELERQVNLITWGVMKSGELGGYAECEILGRVGIMSLICKQSFFNREIAPAVLQMVLTDAFLRGPEILIFEATIKSQWRGFFRQAGGRDVGKLDAENGKPERMAMALTSGDWQFEQRLEEGRARADRSRVA